jgi:hypothetical protein
MGVKLMLEHKPYLLMDGLKEIAQGFTGTENIFLGIKPYGFHAGNKIPFVAYPILLCEELERHGKKAKFNFFVFINDWEQTRFDPEKTNWKEFPFNVIPQFTTFQFSKDKTHDVDYWENVICSAVHEIKEHFPNVSIKCVRNSSMRDLPIMKEVVLKTIKSPDLLGNIMSNLGFPLHKNFPYTYCNPICPKCTSARTVATITKDDNISLTCSDCGHRGIYEYHDLYYWLYHKILALPRIKYFDIDLCISGLDHYKEKDFDSRYALYDAYGIKMKPTYILYTPALHGTNGLQMGKSRNNCIDIETEKLLSLLRKNPSSYEIYIEA